MAGLAALAAEGLKIQPRLEGTTLKLVASGAVEARDPGALLDPFWEAVDAQVLVAGVRRVELDLRGIDFMNSSGILTLVKWVSRLKAMPDGVRYELVIQHDRNVTWQKSNVPVLAKLAPSVVRVEAV